MSSYPPPLDEDPTYTGLLEAEAAARQALQAARAEPSPSAMTNAEWNLTEASADTLAHELRQAGNWNHG